MNTVVDRVVQYPHRYQLKNVNTSEILGTFDLEPITGTISVVGTKIDKALFDSIATDIGARLVSNGGDAKDNIITYTIASDRSNIVSGEKLSVSFGKIARYINDLKAIAFSGNKSDIGLGNVDNTSDLNKPISNDTQKALDLKADKKDVSEVDIDVEGTGSIVSIPENATGYGTIEKLGGKSYKSENLFNGAEYGSISGPSGEDMEGGNLRARSFYIPILPNTYYSISANNSSLLLYELYEYGSDKSFISPYASINDSTFTFLTRDNTYYIRVLFKNTTNTDFNLDILDYVMLNKGSESLPYEPYFEGIKIEYPTNVKVVGRNLCNGSLFVDNKGFNSKGVIVSASGYKATEEYISIKPNTTYTITNATAYGYKFDKTFDNFINSNTFTTKSTMSYIRIESRIGNNAMLVEGSTALPYTPYTEQNLPQTNAINYVSNELQTNYSWTQENASKWLGLGVGNDSNIINYANNKKGDVKYGIVDLGTLSFDIVNGIYISTSTINAKLPSWANKFNGLSSNYEISTYLNQTNNSIAINDDNSKLYVKTDTTPTGLLIYELATPIEIDLSSLDIEAHFECEPNGSIIHDNIANYKYSFPVSLKGQVELNFEHDKEQQRDIDSLKSELNAHTSNKNNPHNVTKEQLGLGNVGNFKAVSTVANQGLTEDEKSNARENIGAGTSSFSGSYNDLTDTPTIPEVNYPVTSVNGKTGAVNLSASDVGARPSSWTPSKTDIGLENVDNTSDSEKEVASAKVLKNNDVYDFDISNGITPYSIDLNDNHVYLIYNDHWSFVLRVKRPNDNNYSQSTVCINESSSKPVWFIYQNAKLKLKTTKVVNSNTFVVVEENYNGKFNYKLLSN